MPDPKRSSDEQWADYVFNREWDVFQAGTPYNDGITQDQNIFELDTMTGFGNANNPEPSSALLAVIGFVTLLSTGRIRRRK